MHLMFGPPIFTEKSPIVVPSYPRQERILIVPIIHLLGILSGKAKVWLPEEIPSDCFALRTFQDESTHSICIVVSHPKFGSIKEGYSIPKYSIVVTYPDPTSTVREPGPELEPGRPSEDTLDNREV